MYFIRSWRKAMWFITVLSRREGFFLHRRKGVRLVVILSRWEGMWLGLRLRRRKGFCLRLRVMNGKAVVLARVYR